MNPPSPSQKPPELDRHLWATIRRYLPAEWARRAWLLVAALIACVAALAATAPLWDVARGMLTSPLVFVSIDSEPGFTGVIDLVVRNRSSAPVVVTRIVVAIDDFTVTDIEDSSSIPVSSVVNAMVSTQRGLHATVSRPRIQILPNSIDRMQIAVGTTPRSRPALIDYTVTLRLEYEDEKALVSKPFHLRVTAPRS